MNEPANLAVRDYWNIAVRRKWLIIGIILFSLGMAGVLCLVLPKSYRSSTLVMVESQKIPENYVKAILEAGIDERLAIIQHQVMSRTLLHRVIDEFQLYRDVLRREGLEAAIETMRKQIKVETLGTARGKGVDAFSISFGHQNPMTAMRVTAKLTARFIEENLRVREQLVAGASEFLEQELNAAKARLEEQEPAISQFKSKYMGELPEQTEANLRALDRLQYDQTMATDSLQNLTNRLGMIEKAIQEYESTWTTTSALVRGKGKTEGLAVRLKELEHELSVLSAEYKETFPDVVQVKREIAKIKAQLAGREGAGGEDTTPLPSDKSDPFFRELMKQRDGLKVEIASLKDRQRRLNGQIREYGGRVERAPAHEQESMILQRDYKNLQDNYRSLLDKKLSARVAENLEKRQKGEQFRVIDPANLPEKPEKPNRLLIMVVGLVVGCGVGVGGALAMEQFRVSFQRPDEVESMLQIPILAVIPLFEGTPRERARPLLRWPGLPALIARQNWGGLRLRSRDIGNGNGRVTNCLASSGRKGSEPRLVSKSKPASMEAEQFRVAATKLVLMVIERHTTVIVVTSAVMGEGKSTTVANLGHVLANDLEKSTLVIDCDLKHPTLHTYFDIEPEPGLFDLLQCEASLNGCLRMPEGSSLWTLPAGSIPAKPIELAKIRKLGDLLSGLKNRFEYILLDAPPILPLADMNVLARMADVLVLVVRAGETSREVVQKALKTLNPGIQMGAILNGLRESWTPYYMRKGYYTRSYVQKYDSR